MTRLTFLLIASCCSTMLSAQGLTPEQRSQLDRLTNRGIDPTTPGLAVGVVRGGEIIYETYAGLADLKAETPIQEETLFNIASNGKQFTAWCVLELINAGKLSLTDDIRSYLPEILANYPESITIQHLLNHSSGILDVYDLWNIQGIVWWKKRGLTNDDALALIERQQSVQFKPGTDYSYSNSNYLLLAAIIARVSGQEFSAYAKTRLIALGMENSVFLADHRQKLADLAKPYFNFGKWSYYPWRSSLHGDGAFFTTLQDQLQWEVLLQRSSSNARKEQLEASQELLPNTTTDRYGYGLEFGTYRSLTYRFHHGTTGAWKASFMRFPEQELSIVVMTNSGAVYPPGLSRRLANVLLEGAEMAEHSYPHSPTTINDDLDDAELSGTYAAANGFYFRIIRQGRQWILARSGRSAITIEREQGNLFHQVDDTDFKQYFQREADGTISLSAYYPSHAPYTLTKVVMTPAPGADQWTGDFYNADLDVKLRIEHEGDELYQLRFQGRRQHKRTAELIAPGRMYAQGYGITFERDANGKVIELRLANNRVRGLRFTKRE